MTFSQMHDTVNYTLCLISHGCRCLSFLQPNPTNIHFHMRQRVHVNIFIHQQTGLDLQWCVAD